MRKDRISITEKYKLSIPERMERQIARLFPRRTPDLVADAEKVRAFLQTELDHAYATGAIPYKKTAHYNISPLSNTIFFTIKKTKKGE